MLKIDIICIGHIKKGPYLELINEYKKRTKWSVNISEFESRQTNSQNAQKDEQDFILKKINDKAIIVALDERGNGLKSLDFAKTIQNFQNNSENHIQFIIGGSDGLTDIVRDKANMLLSFGQQTWPHLMVRLMLMEQIYRAQQIIVGHPYHRE